MDGAQVALKVEKPDKNRKVLTFEYQVLKNLQGLPTVCKVYEFVMNPEGSNFIVMQLLGKNLASIKKSQGKRFPLELAVDLL